MTANDFYRYFIRCAWPGRAESPASIGRKFIQTLDDLRKIDPVLGEWGIGDNRTYTGIPLEDSRYNIESIVENNVILDDYGDPSPDEGYHLIGINSRLENPLVNSRSVSFKVDAGSKWRNEAEFRIGDFDIAADPSILTYHLFKNALSVITTHWPCPWATASAFKSEYWKSSSAPGIPPMPYSKFHLAWIGYLSAPLAVGFTPPPSLLSERTPDEGWLISAVDTRLDPTDPQHMTRSRQLVELMIERTGEISTRRG
ncbi:MAG: hypothetical protein P4L64_02985 [Caulobacteraceae bacterium]|nr:hypothetical protein [Caulobacteraceae bacterium]